jgi:hypothetical protein
VQNVDPNGRFDLDFGAFKEGMKEAAIGAVIGVSMVLVVAAAVVAAPLVLPAAAASSLAAAVTAAASAATVIGVAATAKTGFEVASGQDLSRRRKIDERERSKRLGEFVVEAAATIVDGKGVRGPPTAKWFPVPTATLVPSPSNAATASFEFGGQLVSTIALVRAGGAATIGSMMMMMMMSGGGGGGSDSGGGSNDGGSGGSFRPKKSPITTAFGAQR